MANFEAFRWNFLSSTNPEIGRSGLECKICLVSLRVIDILRVVNWVVKCFDNYVQIFNYCCFHFKFFYSNIACFLTEITKPIFKFYYPENIHDSQYHADGIIFGFYILIPQSHTILIFSLLSDKKKSNPYIISVLESNKEILCCFYNTKK